MGAARWRGAVFSLMAVLLGIGLATAGAARPALATSAPSISVITPASGSVGGGTRVTITGAGFMPGAEVTIGGLPAAATVASDTEILATAPASPAGTVGAANVRVTNPDGGTVTFLGGFYYTALADDLSIAGMLPAKGLSAGGEKVMVAGSGFASDAAVFFGATPAPLVAWLDASMLFVLTPAGAPGTVSVTVQNPDGRSATLPGAFTFTGTGGGSQPLIAAPLSVARGSLASTPVYSSGALRLAQVVFNGGMTSQLEAALIVAGAQGAWAQASSGAFVLYVVGAPSFANAPFTAAFPRGFVGVTALTLVEK